MPSVQKPMRMTIVRPAIGKTNVERRTCPAFNDAQVQCFLGEGGKVKLKHSSSSWLGTAVCLKDACDTSSSLTTGLRTQVTCHVIILLKFLKVPEVSILKLGTVNVNGSAPSLFSATG